ncbi:glycosyltransferase family 4 protein [Roseococcus sp. DSY-14]|uniref:glycosyltransferase family 4 protein n=1 Tax=Roseococcus sp. DSY-14 TaxID=3369650 RepID=UPI00387ACDAB
MPAEPLPVLFVHYGEEWIRGSEQVLLDLLRHLDRGRIAPVVWCNGAAMAEAVAAMGLAVTRSPMRFFLAGSGAAPLAPGQWAAQARQGLELLRAHGIRAVHANSGAPVQWMAPAAARAGVPLLAHLHIRYLRRSRYALLLHQADLAVGVAAHVTQALAADGMPAERLRTIPNGIDPARLEGGGDLRARLGIPPGAPLVGSVGSLIRRKGHDLLLRAVAGLEGVHLAIAGSGGEEGALRALAAELGLGGRVHFAGNLQHPAELYRAADLCALASRSESFGLALAEAGWFARPSVAAAVGGVPEVLRDGETGLLVPPDDADALRAALRSLLEDPARRGRLGAAARRDVEARFLAPAMAGAFTAAWEGLAAAGRARGGRLRPYLPIP